MKLNPVFTLWVILPIMAILFAFVVWRLLVAKGRPGRIAWLRRTIIVVLVGLMAIGPSIPGGYSLAGMVNIDVIFVVDTTTSMGAEDYNGTNQRLAGARADIIKLSNEMVGARFSIISFDSSARVLLPMTSDRSSLGTVAMSIVRENTNSSKGSTIDQPISAILTQLVANKKQNTQRPNLLFYLGDGEQTVKAAPKSFSALKSYVSGGAVLGYGTTTGAKMKTYFGYGDENACLDYPTDCYLLDYSKYPYVPSISKANPTLLQNIATQTGLTYADRNNGGDISDAFKATHAETIADHTRQVTYYTNLYFVLAYPLVALLTWELLVIVKKYRETLDRKGAHHG